MRNSDDGAYQVPDPSAAPAVGPGGAVAQFEAAADSSATGEDRHLLPDRLCRAVAEVLGVDGVAISVYLGADIAVPVGANTVDATLGEALQFTVREGPCFEAYASRRPVLVPDIDQAESPGWSRWPTYAAQLTRHSHYHGVFAYPLLSGGIAMGSLSLYRRGGGQPDNLHDAGLLAARVAEQLLEAELFTGPDGEPAHQWMDGPASRRRRLVWLAQGLTIQANQITPGQALDLLRAQAFTDDRLLDDLAADIVAGRLPVPILQSHQ
jgi:hypothetical protein